MDMIDNKKDEYIQKRLNKVLETRLDADKETLEALCDLSTFFTENTLKSRRNLRSQIEKRSLAINEVITVFNANLQLFREIFKNIFQFSIPILQWFCISWWIGDSCFRERQKKC
jgi:hypothetical protein